MLIVIRSITAVVLVALTAGCGKRAPAPPPTAAAPPVTAPAPTETRAPAPETPVVTRSTVVEDKTPVAPPLDEDSIGSRSLEELSALLKPAFFALDSAELDETGRGVVTANADILRKNRTWQVTIEGHADERGTPEYNLALGARRAQAVKVYLVSLGIAQERLATVSYGEEFPFDPGHTESAWSKNRRAYFQITAK
jgi:peptidoglycan-associated lipoprotein